MCCCALWNSSRMACSLSLPSIALRPPPVGAFSKGARRRLCSLKEKPSERRQTAPHHVCVWEGGGAAVRSSGEEWGGEGRSRERKFRCAYVTQNSLPEEAASPTAPAPSEAALPTAPAPSDKAPPVASSAADAAPWAPDATAPAPSSAALKPVHRVWCEGSGH